MTTSYLNCDLVDGRMTISGESVAGVSYASNLSGRI